MATVKVSIPTLADSFPEADIFHSWRAIVMTHGEQGTSQDLGGAGSIELTPDASTKVYPHQGLCIVATVTMTGSNKIPEGATIDFSGSSKGVSSHFVALLGQSTWTNVPIDIAPGNASGTAKLFIRHDYSDTSNSIVMNATAGSEWIGAAKPDDASTVTYTLETTDPTIICSGPSSTLLELPTGQGDQLTPAATQYTTSFTCVVKDGENPVPGYVVEWHEGSDQSFGLFSSLVNAYTSSTAAWADVLPSADAVFVKDINHQGYYVRMMTDANGVASLYLVAKDSAGPIAQSVTARHNFNVTYEYPRPFLVMDINNYAQALEDSYPRILDPMTNDTLNFDDLQNPPYVTVSIPHYKDAHPADNVYLVVNNAIAGGPYHYKTDSSSVPCEFLASLAYSDLMPGGQKNEMLFVVGGMETGLPSASTIRGFFGTGNNIQLTGGNLDAPELYPYAGHINQTTLSKGFVTIQVELKQPDASWNAQLGDVVSATAVLTGYRPDSDALRVPITVPANVLPPIAEGDLRKGSVLLHFPAAPFEGWDQKKDGGTQGQCCIVYTVVRAGQPNQSSGLLTVILNTANQSYTPV
ncbi:MAG TPA: hypothetical protein VHC91_24725 [Trinickia sp.]|nr:hypothetical protein [Trinickia sp.]